MTRQLSELDIGDKAIVFDIKCGNATKAMLRYLGMNVGDEVVVEAKSFYNKTIKIALVNSVSKMRIAIRDTEAALILVNFTMPELSIV